MSRVLGIAAALTLSVAACGGGSGDDEGSADSSANVSPPAESTSSSPPSVTEAASDLSDFVCQPDTDGQWDASGVVTNSTGKPADYRVTVVVTEEPGGSIPGRRRTLTDLAPGVPKPFEIEGLPASGETDALCQVEVLRLP